MGRGVVAAIFAGIVLVARLAGAGCPDAGTPEICNGLDDDCDGVVDNAPDGGTLCAPGKECVTDPSAATRCAARCPQGDFACSQSGFVCIDATWPATGDAAGKHCFPDPCGNCAVRTGYDGDAAVCAPDAAPLPACVCKPVGCRDACWHVVCDAGKACREQAPYAGICLAVHDAAIDAPLDVAWDVVPLGDAAEDGSADAGEPSDAADEASPKARIETRGGCACASAPGAPGGAPLLVLLALLSIPRRTGRKSGKDPA